MSGERDPDLLRMLTVQQPWAYGIAEQLKPVENRTQRTRHRGTIAIHAGLMWSVRGDNAARTSILEHARAHDLTTLARGSRPGTGWTRGAVIALVDIVGCHQAKGGCCAPYGEQGDGVWHWELDLHTVRRLSRPVPARGQLGLWTASKELRAAVWAAA